jgi:hypothetical protein
MASIDLGRYYLADAGYMLEAGYMTPFRNTRYHQDEFKGVNLSTLGREEKFNYIHAGLHNIIERKFGVLKERWHILEKVPYFRRDKQATHPPTYPMSEWVEANRKTDIVVVRDWISAVMWGAALPA